MELSYSLRFRWGMMHGMMGRMNKRAINKGDSEVKMGRLIPSLKRMNVNLKHRRPEKMSKSEMDIFFQIMNEIMGDDLPITPEEEEAFQAYQNSFLKKRLLHEWNKITHGRLAAMSGAGIIQIKASQSVYVSIIPMLRQCFFEEYPKSSMILNPFTLRAFLWNQQYLTRKFGLTRDSRCWGEIFEWIERLDEECFT